MARAVVLALLGLAAPVAADAPVRLGSDRFRQANPVTAIAYSPDGKQLATADGDAVQLWDAADGRRVRTIRIEGHEAHQLCFAPDGRTLFAVTHSDYGLRTHLCRIDLAAGAAGPCQQIAAARGRGAFAPDGSHLAVCDVRKNLTRVLETATGQAVFSEPPNDDPLIAFGFRGDGQVVALGSGKGRVRVCDLATGKVLHDYRLNGLGVASLTFSPDGKDLVATNRPFEHVREGDAGGGVSRFDAATGRVRWRRDVALAKWLAFDADGTVRFLGTTADVDSPVAWRWLDTATGEPLDRTMEAETGPVALRPDGKVLAVGSVYAIVTRIGIESQGAGGLISQWDLTGRKRLEAGSADPPELVTDLRFTPNGSKVVGWARGRYEWDVRTGNQVRRSPPLPPQRASESIGSADDRWLARIRSKVGGYACVEVVDLRTGAVREIVSRLRHFYGLRFLADGRLVVQSADGLEVFDPATGRPLTHIKPVVEWNDHVTVSDDGSTAVGFLVHESRDSFQAVRYDLATGRRLGEWVGRLPYPVDANGGCWPEGLSADGRLFAVSFTCPGPGHRPRQVAVFEARTGRLRSAWKDQICRPGLEFSPDQRSVACYCDRGLGVDVREVATGGLRQNVPSAHPVTGCAFSPDGRGLAFATPPGPVDLYDLIGKPAGAWADRDSTGLWDGLGGENAEVGFAAIRALRAHPAEAVGLLRSRIKVPTTPTAGWVAARLKALDAPLYRDRERATAELTEVGELIVPALTAAQATATPEVRERLTALLAKAEALTPDKLRAIRACEVLEGMGTPEARELLAVWAKGPAATLTREATESLDRLRRR